MASVELATAYVTLAAEGSEITKTLAKAFSQGEKMASQSGQKMGKAMGDAMAKKDPYAKVTAAAEKAESAQEKLATATERAARSQEQSARTVQIAEKKVQEVRERSIRANDEVKAAEKQLAAARKADDTAAIVRAEKALADARDNVVPSSADLAAEDRLLNARQKQGESAELAKVKLEGYRKAQAKANSELDEAKRSAEGAERSTKGAGSAFERMGDRIKSAMKGDFRSAFKQVESDADVSADRVRREFDQAGDRAGRGFAGGFKDKLKGGLVGVAATIGAYVGVDQIMGFTNAAGDLEQSVGAVETVFKDGAGQMQEWSRNASGALGLSANEYNEAASVLGASMKNTGTPMDELAGKTNKMIGLAADLSATYGGSTATALEAIQAALRGEMDPIEKYGVALNDAALVQEGLRLGITKTKGAWSIQDKALLTQSLLFKQTADAQGQFNRESDTYSHKQQVMIAKWNDMKVVLGEKLMPVLGDFFGWISDKLMPAVEKFSDGLGGIWEFVTKGNFAGSENFFGLEEDSALVGFLFDVRDGVMGVWQGVKDWAASDSGQAMFETMRVAGERLWNDVLKPFGAWFMEQVPKYAPTVAKLAVAFGAVVAAIAGLGIGAVIAMTLGAIATTVGVVWPVIKAIVDWIQYTAWPAIVVAFRAIASAAVWLWRNVLVPAWNGIKAAISATVDWLVNTAWPFIKSVWDAISAAAMWLWKNVIKPVWDGIRIAIAIAVTAIIVSIEILMALWRNVLAPALNWLYRSVIKPVWAAIRAAISAVVAWFKDTAWPTISKVIGYVKTGFNAMRDSLKAAWRFVMDRVISPVIAWFKNSAWPAISRVIDAIKAAFNALRDSLKAAWKFIKDNIIAPVVNWLADKVSPKVSRVTGAMETAFDTLKTGVLKAWNAIKSGMKKPINGVIDIYNKHIAGNFNKVIDTIFGDEGAKKYKLSPMQGFATGGYTGPGSKYQPAGVVHADEFVIRKESQNSLRREAPGFLDALNTHGARALSSMGYGYAGGGRVLGGWREIAAIPHKGMAITSTVRRGARTAGSGSVSKHAQGLAVDFAGAAGAMRSFFNFVRDNYSVSELIHTPMGGRQLSRGGRPRANFPAATARTHYNHVHVGGWGPGEKAGAGAFAGASTSGSGQAEGWGIPNPFDGLWSSIKGKVTDAVGGGALGEMLSQTVENTVGGIKGWVTGKIDSITGAVESGVGAARWTPMAVNALTREGQMSPGNLDSLLRRMNQESGYNPQAINNWDSNAAKGTPSKGLMQVIDPTFRAYRDPSLPNDIWNPLANTVASIRYAMSRYGSVKAAYDRSGGYASGGWTGPGSKYAPAGVVHADEYVVQKSSRRSIEKARPGFLDRLNRLGAAALNGYASGGLVGYASGGKVSPTAKIGSSKVTVILDGLLGTEKQVKTAAGKLADGIAKTFQDKFKGTQKATVARLSDSLKALNAQQSQLKKTMTSKSSDAKKSTVNRLSDDLASLKKRLKGLDPKKQASQYRGLQKQIESTQSALTKARRGDYSGAASATASKLKDVQKQIASTEAALKQARRGNTSAAATKAADAFFTKYAVSATSKLQALAKQSDSLTAKLKNARTALTDAMKVRDEYAGSLTEKFAGGYALTAESATTGIETIIRGFKNSASTVKLFTSQLGELKSKGLSSGLIDQVAQLGAADGSKVAKNLLSGTDSQIKQITAQYNALNTVSSKSGTALGQQMHQAGVDSAKGLVRGLESQLSNVEKASKNLANKVVSTVRKQLKIKSPSRVFAEIGEFTGEGMVVGIERVIPDVQGAMSRLATPPEAYSGDMQVSAPGGRNGSGALIENATVYGLSAEDVAVEFDKVVRRRESLYV